MKSFTSSYQACTAGAHSGVPMIVYLVHKFWPTSNMSGTQSAKCRSEIHKMPLALLHSAYRLASSYKLLYNFTWPVRHSPHSAMICTAHHFGGPTALAVTTAGCCNVSISQNVHLIYRSSIMTAGQDTYIIYVYIYIYIYIYIHYSRHVALKT